MGLFHPLLEKDYRKVLPEKQVRVVITLPIYNEAPRLEANFKKLYSFLMEKNWQAQIILAEDGSTDESFEIAARISKCYENIKVFHSDMKLGRGKAIRNAWSAVSGDVYVFMDADMATDLKYLPTLVRLVTEKKYDFVTGSRYASGARVSRPLLRRAFSVFYNALVRFLFQTGVFDHQCGFKAFNDKAAKVIVQFTREDSWAWDTEVIIVLKQFNFKIGEIGVNWEEKKYKQTSIRRLLCDIFLHGKMLLKLFILTKAYKKFEKEKIFLNVF